jgi:ABC-type transport system involved in Fe-S cluster assembly fused permease/ATPase subunit
MSTSYQRINSSRIDAVRFLELLNTKPAVADYEHAKNLIDKEGKVEFKDVDFAYNSQMQIIEKVNFSVEGGKTVALVGETGGGKSTILKLLFRFYDATSGTISIDGQYLPSVTLSSLRDSLGLVPQDPALFNQTIRQIGATPSLMRLTQILSRLAVQRPSIMTFHPSLTGTTPRRESVAFVLMTDSYNASLSRVSYSRSRRL